MKFTVASLLAAAAAAGGSHGHGHGLGLGYAHAHTKLVKKVVPTVDYVKVAKKSYVDVAVPTTVKKDIVKTYNDVEVYSNDSGDGIDSDYYVPSVSSISGSTHVHNSSSASSDSSSSSSDSSYGVKLVKKGYGHGYGKKVLVKSYSSDSSSSDASAADHTHAYDGSSTYVHSHGSVSSKSSISADSSADEHLVQKQYVETVEVPATKIVQKPVISYETKAVKGYDTVLAKVQGPLHAHGYAAPLLGAKLGYAAPLSYSNYKKW